MLFKYSINIDVEATFELPLLGADISGQKRKVVDKFAKDVIKEFIGNGKHTGKLDKTYEGDNITVTVKCGKHLGNANLKR
jgi:hypothetical protein